MTGTDIDQSRPQPSAQLVLAERSAKLSTESEKAATMGCLLLDLRQSTVT
ncbi:hypothetical protein [Nocardia sp. SSK8]